MTPANTTAGGPRGILALSSGSASRDFLLGRQLQSFSALVRTTSTTPDAQPAIISAPFNRAALTHLVYTRDGAGTETIYVDARPVGFSVRGGDFSGWDAATSVSIGNEPGASGENFHGAVHLAAVYCRTLSASEIFQNYLAGP